MSAPRFLDTLKRQREELGSWPEFAWPGGYLIVYYADDCEMICAGCMNLEPEIHFDGDADGWRIDGADIYFEGPTALCAHCGTELRAAYGNPWEDEPEEDSDPDDYEDLY